VGRRDWLHLRADGRLRSAAVWLRATALVLSGF